MTATRDRLLELLTDRALVGLGQREQIELAELLVKVQDVDIAAFDKAAAAIALATLGPLEEMPASLAERLEQAALDGPGRPASDYMKTRQLDKLAPGLVHTQVDEILEPDSIGPASSELEPEEESLDFKKTLTLAQEPASIPTLARPNDPYVAKRSSTTTHPIVPTPLVPSPAPPRAYSSQPSGPVPSSYGRAPSPPAPSPPAPSPPAPSLSNVVPFQARRGPSRAFAIAGWVAAAACLLLAIGAFALRRPAGPVAALTPAELRDRLLAAEGTARAEWTPTTDPLGKAATGEVVWNKDQQKGVMRFRGLAKNDPSRAQYQLWIFDKTRDEKYPVDGGVFDVDSETGDVVVPIHATLPVNAPVLFAVTLERPGGVVVSKRDRIVVTAKLPAG